MGSCPQYTQIISGALGALLLTACGGGGGGGSANLFDHEPDPFDDLKPYVVESEYSDVLINCVKASAETSCTLNRLPIIGMEVDAPTVTDIMSRVVVSHDWMGQRFQQALEVLPADIRLLLRATTAIVIDADIRPAYYTFETGAIYLDPAYLWLTSAELATINQQEDPRAGFSDPLQFRSLARYLENDSFIYPYNLLDENPNKTIDDVSVLIGRLLYHELAHANDFLPPSTWDFLDPADSAYEAIVKNEQNFIAVQLAESDPLTSSELRALAKVMYHGNAPTAQDLTITASEVGELFEADGANDHYAYSSIFEDTAMLFEETMMKYHFDTDREVAFSAVPAISGFCNQYIIGWGIRNRLGDTDVKARAQFVAGEMLPSAELSLFFQELPLPQLMTPGDDWCLDAPVANGVQKQQLMEIPLRDLRVPHTELQR